MKIKWKQAGMILLVLLTLLTSGCSKQTEVEAAVPSSIVLKVHFIDVGQGDSTLIQLTDGKNVLIDGGNRADAAILTNYLQDNKVKTIDYLIATHPHEDHIGSLANIIKNFKITSIYMPKVAANTKTFEDMLSAIKQKGYKINTAAAGVKIIDTKDVKLNILAPNSSEYDELNNYSAVVKLTYQNTSFLFTGDAEDVSEKEILKKNVDIKANVIKIGHHGGRTSTTKEFLSKVEPQYAVISVGKENDYGHPHKETIDRLSQRKLNTYRTDLQGTIVASSDGRTITFNTLPASTSVKPDTSAEAYIGNKNSKIFHLPSCSGLPNSENQVKFKTKSEAQSTGYKACQRCKP